MVILSIDIGKTFGAAVSVDNEIEFTQEITLESLAQVEKWVKDLVDIWKPNLILIPYPTRFYYVIIKHAKIMGVSELLAEKKEITVIEVNAATCKKVVLGSGKARKEDIANHYKSIHPDIKSEHILDCVMFRDWFVKAS